MRPGEQGGFVLEGAAEIAAAAIVFEYVAQTVSGTEQMRWGDLAIRLSALADPSKNPLTFDREKLADPDEPGDAAEFAFPGVTPAGQLPTPTVLNTLRQGAQYYPDPVVSGVLDTALQDYDTKVFAAMTRGDEDINPA